MAYKLKPNEHFAEDSSLPVGPSPMNSERGSSEKQDREEPLPSADLSIAALKANLFYYEIKKQKAFEEHKAAIIKAHEASTALNNALLRVRSSKFIAKDSDHA